jgi:hypothetical protein
VSAKKLKKKKTPKEGEEEMENARCFSDVKEMGMCKH